MTGAKHNMLAQANRANNLANLNTTGFRADFEQSRSMGVYYGAGQPTRAYALTESPRADFTSGSMIATGNDLDIAIQGNGFIAVLLTKANARFSRSSQLPLEELGG
jgi:flagellar basal-body rod protein FlgF